MLRDDLFDGFTRTKAFENTFHSDSGSGNHRLSHHDIGFGLDEVHSASILVQKQDSSTIFRPADCEPKPILFIDEIHLLLGAGKAGGSMDAANILKPALARGAIRVIGATTIKEYRQSIEKDGALERRFQSVIILTSKLGAGQMRRKMGFGMEQEGSGQDARATGGPGILPGASTQTTKGAK